MNSGVLNVETSSAAVASMAIPEFSRAITDADLTITPAARGKMAELFGDVDDDVNAIRVFVTGGGCSGMSYGMTFTDQVHETDCLRDEEGFSLYVDAVAMGFLQGVEIDFVDRGPSGASFVFNNAFTAAGDGGGGGGCPGCGASSR
jgi:iron-sulfur cluster insertion protein